MPTPSQSPTEAKAWRATRSPSSAAAVTIGPVTRSGSPPRHLVQHRRLLGHAGPGRSGPARCPRSTAPSSRVLPHSQGWPSGHDLHVPELAGHAVGAAQHPPSSSTRPADAGAHRDHQRRAARRAPRRTRLGAGGAVGVVVEQRPGSPSRSCEQVAQRLALPRQVRGEHHPLARRRRRSRPRRRRRRRAARRRRPRATASTSASSTWRRRPRATGRRPQRGATTRARRRRPRRRAPWCRRCRRRRRPVASCGTSSRIGTGHGPIGPPV